MKWRDFTDKVDEVFNIKNLEMAPVGDTIKPLTIYKTEREKMSPSE